MRRSQQALNRYAWSARQLQRTLARSLEEAGSARRSASVQRADRPRLDPAQRTGGNQTTQSGWFARQATERLDRDPWAVAAMAGRPRLPAGKMGPSTSAAT